MNNRTSSYVRRVVNDISLTTASQCNW
jgi:hypothetical protein